MGAFLNNELKTEKTTQKTARSQFVNIRFKEQVGMPMTQGSQKLNSAKGQAFILWRW